jgi:serine phosphatase RsbU (regulator of sigma subunit)/anti-sigma regulatory factor (Ser/Thr protein kinase)
MDFQNRDNSCNSTILNERCRILVVDDDVFDLSALYATLKREGYELRTARTGMQALKILKTFSPAIIICDQNMPGINGINTLRKAQELRPEAIRMLLTGSADLETAIEAINIGHVNYYITKPWDNTKLQKTIQTAIEKYKIVRENQILQQLITTQHKKLSIAHNSLLQQVKLGACIQEKLLLGKVPKDFNGATIEAFSYPSQCIDGDFIEFYQQSSHVLDIVFGDVMGKGLAAALVGTAVKTQLLRFALPFHHTQIYTKVTGWVNPSLTPEEIVANIHKEIVQQLIDLEHFVTLFYGRLDCRNKTFSFLDCGSTKPLHLRRKRNTLDFLSGDNLPLGITHSISYRARTILVEEGDLLIFYSDGITEARSPEGELFGSERLAKLIQANHYLPGTLLCELIKKAIFLFSQKEQLDDDLTLIILKMNNFPPPEQTKHMSAQFGVNLSELPLIREFIERICQNGKGDITRLSYEIELAVDEVFCNILQHGDLETGKNRISIEAECNDEGVWVKLSDQGIPFDPSTVKQPTFSGNRTTGFGWHMIREISDLICYTSKGNIEGWNHLSIFKRYHYLEKK